MLSQPDPVLCRSIQVSNAGTVAGVSENRQTAGCDGCCFQVSIMGRCYTVFVLPHCEPCAVYDGDF